MINLAVREIAFNWFRYFFTALGVGLLVGVTLTMAGLLRGMLDDAIALARNSHSDIWVVQEKTQGPFAEASTLYDDFYRDIAGLPGVAEVGNVAYLTVQARYGDKDVRVFVAGFVPGHLGEPTDLVAGRPIAKDHYEAIADVKTGFKIGDTIGIRRDDYTIVGLTAHMISPSADPIVFLTMKDMQIVQFQKDNTSIYNDRNRLAANPRLNRPGMPDLLGSVIENQQLSNKVNAVLVRVVPGYDTAIVAENIRRWKYVEAYTYDQEVHILQVKLVANAFRQIGFFMIILAIVSTAIISLIIYTMTMGKIREIAVMKLIGAKNSVIAGMILQEAVGLGIVGFATGKAASMIWSPFFPRHIEFLTGDTVAAFIIIMIICVLASLVGIRAALRVQPSSALGA